MGSEERFCSYLDIPLQHSHRRDAARRCGAAATRERYLRLLERARELAPDIFLRTHLHRRLPGRDRGALPSTCERSSSGPRFDHLGAFVYSPRGGHARRRAGRGRVPAASRARRHRAAARARSGRSRSPAAGALVGRRLQVLVEGVCEESEHLLQGRHHGMAPEIDGRLLINDGFAPAGTLVEVEITDAYADDLVGHIVGAGRRRRGVGGAPATPAVDASSRRPPMLVVHDALHASDLPRGGDRHHRQLRRRPPRPARVLDLVVARARETGAAGGRSSPSIPIPWRCSHPEQAPSRLTTQAQKEALLDEAGVDVVLVVRFTPELAQDAGAQPSCATSCTGGWRCGRSTSARASSSATGARATWRCCAQMGESSASPRSASTR